MKKNLAASRRLDNTHLLTLLTGAAALGLAMFASSLLAQNNDNGGVLPGMPSGQTKAAQSAMDTVLATDGQMEGTTVNGVEGTLSVSADGFAAVAVAAGVSPDDAEFHTSGSIVAEQTAEGGLLIQGSGTLNTEIGLKLRLQAASQAMARTAILVGDSGSQPLADLLSGKAKPFAAIALGNMPGLDLGLLDHLLQKHAGAAVPFRATVVFVSVDKWGIVHLAAAAGRTDGGPLEIALQ